MKPQRKPKKIVKPLPVNWNNSAWQARVVVRGRNQFVPSDATPAAFRVVPGLYTGGIAERIPAGYKDCVAL